MGTGFAAGPRQVKRSPTVIWALANETGTSAVNSASISPWQVRSSRRGAPGRQVDRPARAYNLPSTKALITFGSPTMFSTMASIA